MHKKRSEKGFTLVELSIVLVIIGLIVGGVLVGQDLIEAARVRAQVTQLEQFNVAVNAFRVKYDGVPGDLGNAAAFGLTPEAMQSAVADLGNGVLDSSGAMAGDIGPTNMDGELTAFWMHLSEANYIPGNYIQAAMGGVAAVPGTNIPDTKLGKGGITAYSNGALNYWLVGTPVAGVVTVAQAIPAGGGLLSQSEAWNIDKKLDDANPSEGQVVAIQSYTPAGGHVAVATQGMDFCHNAAMGGSIDEYDLDPATLPDCVLSVRIQG